MTTTAQGHGGCRQPISDKVTRAPLGFVRVGISDMDHLGAFTRRRARCIEYWWPNDPCRIRRERQIGEFGRKVTWVRVAEKRESGGKGVGQATGV